MTASLSIIIPAHNEQEYLGGLFGSIDTHLSFPAEIIVVDSASTDDTPAIVERFGHTLVKVDSKIWPSRARNLGVNNSAGDILVFLDADVEITALWARALKRIKTRFQEKPELFITGAPYHMSKQPSWIELAWFEPLRIAGSNYINGGNLIVSRSLHERVGGFSEELETGEDVDYCHRATKAGIPIIIDEDLVVHHEGFPKTVSHFVKREVWHGTGDFVSIRKLLHSRTAIFTTLFLLAHLVLLSGIVLHGPAANATVYSAGVILALTAISFLARFRGKLKFRFWIQGFVLNYLYFVGRSAALVRSFFR